MTDLVIPVADVPALRVPPICARTGLPARKTRKLRMLKAPAWTYAFLVFGVLVAVLLQNLVGKRTDLDLPIARRTSIRMNVCLLGIALCGCAAVFGFFWVLSAPGAASGVACVATTGLTVAAVVTYYRSWVHGKYIDDDNVRVTGLDPSFAEAIRAQLVARREAVAPAGWHADPSGQHALRWFDGTAWTAHVHD